MSFRTFFLGLLGLSFLTWLAPTPAEAIHCKQPYAGYSNRCYDKLDTQRPGSKIFKKNYTTRAQRDRQPSDSGTFKTYNPRTGGEHVANRRVPTHR